MKTSYLFLFANIVGSFFIDAVAATSTNRRAYNIMLPNSANSLECKFNLQERVYKKLMQTENHIWLKMQLTPSEADELKSDIASVNGVIAEDKPSFFLQPTIKSAKLRKRKTNPPTPFINGVPNCQATLKGNVEFFVMDTYFNPNSKGNINTFKDVQVAHATTDISPVYCNPHSAYVTAIIVGNNYGVIRHGTRKVYNIPVFICGGAANSSDVYEGIGQAITRAQANTAKGIRSVLNWSLSGGQYDPILFQAVTEAVKYMYFGVAAGNENANICVNRTPWDVAGVSITGGTAYPGNVISYFSNFGKCVQMYCPSIYTMFNGASDQGTSFASPIKVALIGIEADNNPNLTNGELDDLVNSRGTIIYETKAPYANANITVLEGVNACASKLAM